VELREKQGEIKLGRKIWKEYTTQKGKAIAKKKSFVCNQLDGNKEQSYK
jgi:hypothetical protein